MIVPPVPWITKLKNWPTEDRTLWERLLVPGDLFSTGGEFSGWSDGTRRLHAQNYGSWLSFIRRKHPKLLNNLPNDRIRKETVTAFIDEGRERLVLRSISNQILTLAIVAKGFTPDTDWTWLFNASRSLYLGSNPFQLKKPIPITAANLFEGSLELLNQLSVGPISNPVSHATRFRQALTVGLLIARPFRVRTFMAMTVSKHIELSDYGIVLAFAAEEMKDRRARRFPFPEPLDPFMRKYLDTHRPILLQGRDSDALWITRRGNPMSIDSFTGGLASLTKRVFGLSLRPHAFRHIAATSIATDAPEHVGIIRDILSHATLQMAERHYNRATAVGASSTLQALLRDIRSSSRPVKKGRVRRADKKD